MVVGQKKVYKFKRALKSAARLPARVSGGRGSGRNKLSPNPGETPIVLLRVQIIGCKDLRAKEKSGASDPFVVASFGWNRHQTPVAKKNLNPSYAEKDATFDFPVYLSLADKVGVLEIVAWDKDMLRKDYLGEISLSLDACLRNVEALGFEDPHNSSYSVDLVSTRATTCAFGSVQLKVGFVLPKSTNHDLDFREIYDGLLRKFRKADVSLVNVPPTEGMGTIRAHESNPVFEDDGLSSDEEVEGEIEVEGSGDLNSEYEFDERDENAPSTPTPERQVDDAILSIPLSHSPTIPETQADGTILPVPLSHSPTSSSLPLPPSTPENARKTKPDLVVTHPSVPDLPSSLVTPEPVRKQSKGPKFPKMFPRRPSTLTSSKSYDSATTRPMPSPSSSLPPTPGTSESSSKKRLRIRKWRRKRGDYNFNAANDILGIVMLEIQSATDLPKFKNITRTGWDMDPFVVVSFGKKVFRTRVIRHSLNPTWEEKLLFHVRRYESAFKVQLTVLDWDKFSSNDHVGDAFFDVADLFEIAPKKDEVTGLYPENMDSAGIREYKLNLTTAKEMPWEAKHNPVLTVRAKYQPYDALRQRFWRQYLKQMSSEDTGTLSHLELSSMLDSLGSTLSSETIDSFFTRHGKRPKEDELTIDEAVRCLEEELCRPKSEKRRISVEEVAAAESSVPVTPMLLGSAGVDSGTATPLESLHIALSRMDFSGPPTHPTAVVPPSPSEDESQRQLSIPMHPTEPSQQPLSHAAAAAVTSSASTRVPVGYGAPSLMRAGTSDSSSLTLQGRQVSGYSSDGDAGDAEESSGSNSNDAEEVFERVINVKNCPLCHRPRLNSRAEMDIVTHLAVCASQDWSRMDRIVVGNFVTASQAQRKWYTKVITKVSAGNYRLGANSANIIVQNRMTGQLEEEKMQMYVRLGIRLFYKGAKSRMEGARARRLLKSLSIKQGLKYDSPESANDIPAFVHFHNLKVEEILQPLGSFKTFNEFFYRKLKPDARPVEAPEDPTRLVSAADCRMMAFESVSEATRLWIKGREFTIARLLGETYREQAEKYVGGALAIFRLAPQDYHRFHSPVDGKVGAMTYIAGEYYTVNPQAIRTTLDVYGENARKIIPIDSPTFGRVMIACVGAMMVGTIKTTVQEGDEVKRGQELGYFAFGGSTLVAVFEKGVVEWDEDLLINGRVSLETLVRVGMGIGRRVHHNGRNALSRRPNSAMDFRTKSPAFA